MYSRHVTRLQAEQKKLADRLRGLFWARVSDIVKGPDGKSHVSLAPETAEQRQKREAVREEIVERQQAVTAELARFTAKPRIDADTRRRLLARANSVSAISGLHATD